MTLLRRSPAGLGVVLYLFCTGLSFAASLPVPVIRPATRVAESTPVRDLPAISAEAPRKEGDIERENEVLPRAEGPFRDGTRPDPALVARPSLSPNMPGPTVSFEGQKASDLDLLGGRVAPPDTNGDVGPNHYVQTVNYIFRIYDKSGSALTPSHKLSDLFAPLGAPCGTRNDGDVITLYDTLADRWLISQFCIPAFPPTNALHSHQVIAISKTGDPTGAYWLYDFMMPNAKLNDYPHFGVWPDGYYMSDNQFGDGSGSLAFTGAGLFVFEREKMLTGDPTASAIYFDYDSVDPSASGMLPTHLNGLVPPPPGTPNFFMEFRSVDFGDPNDAIRIYEFHADFAHPASSTITARPDLVVAPFDARQPSGKMSVEQPTGGELLDAVADRLMFRVGYRTLAGGVQSFVLNWSVNVSGVNPTDAAHYQAGVRFEELRRNPATGAFSVQNQLTYSTDPGNGATGRNVWMASAAQDHQGNSALGMSASSTTIDPSIVWAGRLAGDPAGTFAQGEATVIAGTGVQSANTFHRWGDYSALTVDPTDECTFWYTQEYYATTGLFNWQTHVANFKFAGCSASPRGTLQGQVTECAHGTPVAGVAVWTGEGFYATTDASGNYSIVMPPGSYTVSYSKTGYTSASKGVAITNGSTTNGDICLTGIPIPEAEQATLSSESCAPPNNAIDPDEAVLVNFCIRNTGGGDTTDLVATLLPIGGVRNPSPPQHYGVVAAGGAPVCEFFQFINDTACGGVTTATFQLQDGASDLGMAEFDLQTGLLVATLNENFDGVTAPNLPPGWVATNAAGPAPLWVTSTLLPDTSPNDAFVDDPAVVSDKRLDSPPIAIETANAQLTFRNNYNLEANFDGAVLEISIAGGPFQDILAAGGSFVSGGYNSVISSAFGSPIAGRAAWSGLSGGYITTKVNLPASANGQNIVLRWRMGSDSNTAQTGWRIDGASVLGAYACCSEPVPVALSVDTHPSGGSSNKNGVLEPGEQVVVAPSWRNGGNSASFTLNGIASAYDGPPGATYTLNDSSAGYASIPAFITADCFGATGDCYELTVNNPTPRPVQHWDASFLESENITAPSGFGIPAKTWTLHIGNSFPDVSTSQQFYGFIENLFHNGVTAGCGGGNYCPDKSVTRAQASVFILKAKHGSTFVPPACTSVFADVACPSLFADWIEELHAEGITGGCGGSNYCPDNPVTRGQMAVFLLKGGHGGAYVPPACATTVFTDVPCPSAQFVDFINQLTAEAITGGCGGSNYCPTDPVKRGQMAVFLVKTFGLLLYGP